MRCIKSKHFRSMTPSLPPHRLWTLPQPQPYSEVTVFFEWASTLPSFRYLLLLLWAFNNRLIPGIAVSVAVTVGIFHLSIAAGAAVVVRVELFANFRLRLRLEVFVDALIILVRAASVCCGTVVTRRKVIILKCCSQNGSRLLDTVSLSLRASSIRTYVIRHFILCFDAFSPEEVFEWLLFLAVVKVSYANRSEVQVHCILTG
jgi:hypothetical protein